MSSQLLKQDFLSNYNEERRSLSNGVLFLLTIIYLYVIINKKNIIIEVINQNKPLTPCPDIWLLFAPLKKDNTDFVIEKATELGVKKIIPVNTRYTNSSNIKIERFIAQSIEASEQCRRTDLPEITPLTNLTDILNNWDSSRTLFFMDETLNSKPFIDVLKNTKSPKSAILIGPEGGFSKEELSHLRNLNFAIGAISFLT